MRRYEGRDATKALFPILGTEGLEVGIFGGNVNKGNTRVQIATAYLTLTAAATNYVFIDWEAGTIEFNTTGFPKDCTPLYVFTTDGADITETDDCRSVLRQSAHTDYITKTTFLANGNFNADTGWVNLDLSSDAPEGATGAKIVLSALDSGTPGLAVYLALRKPGETAVSQELRLYPQVTGLYVSQEYTIGLDDLKKVQYRARPSGTMSAYMALAGWIFG